MTPQQLAQVQFLIVQSYWRGDISADDNIALMTALGNQAFEAGFEEEYKAAFSELCRSDLQRPPTPRKRATSRK
jgi:hypothetical protein